MSGFLTKLFLLYFVAQIDWPQHHSRDLELTELPIPGAGIHRYSFHLNESQRHFHFEVELDSSACAGPLALNGQKLTGQDVSHLLRFDQANEILVSGCIERIPQPVRVVSLPRVHIASARPVRRQGLELELEVRLRNTLLNSASCSLETSASEQQFLLGPETSQTRRLFVRLYSEEQKSVTVKLWKFAEAVEGNYQHVLEVPSASPN